MCPGEKGYSEEKAKSKKGRKGVCHSLDLSVIVRIAILTVLIGLLYLGTLLRLSYIFVLPTNLSPTNLSVPTFLSVSTKSHLSGPTFLSVSTKPQKLRQNLRNTTILSGLYKFVAKFPNDFSGTFFSVFFGEKPRVCYTFLEKVNTTKSFDSSRFLSKNSENVSF
jgi:hypothetical protein